MSYPEVPKELTERAGLEHEFLDFLWNEIKAELADEQFKSRAHHNASTYNKGCHGPLCTKAHREHPRRSSDNVKRMQPRDVRAYDPAIEFFYTVLKYSSLQNVI